MPDELPDDPAEWPSDPFRVLGVEPPVTETELKRAYTRLIRRFKPEHAPEQFRRVREAYETALDRLKWYGHVDAGSGEEIPFVPPVVVVPPGGTSPASLAPEDEAWALATSHREAEAYARLLDLDRARSEDAELSLRLYWLLAVHPGFDASRSRHDWLATALRRSQLTGPAVELYRRELDIAPETALFGPYLRLLEGTTRPAAALALARLRLPLAGLSRAWNVVDVDLLALSRHVAELDEVAWLGHLVTAMGYLVFDFPEPAFGRCESLIAGMRHLELREGWAFDQLEEQLAVAKVWGEAHAVPEMLRDVVRNAWVAPDGMWRRAMARASEWVLRDPGAVLPQLDFAMNHYPCRPVLSAVDRLLKECVGADTPPMRPELIRGAVRAFLVQKDHLLYDALRHDLLRFLVEEAIDPDAMVSACVQDPSLPPQLLAQRLRADLTLQLVWRIAYAGG